MKGNLRSDYRVDGGVRREEGELQGRRRGSTSPWPPPLKRRGEMKWCNGNGVENPLTPQPLSRDGARGADD